MKITICGSMFFAEKMMEIQQKLDEMGHDAYIPGSAEICLKYVNGEMDNVERADDKIENDWMGKHMDLILSTDGILVLNYDKKGKKNYIGGNTFVEMVFAKYLQRDIYMLNDIPEESAYKDEIIACQPIVIKGDLSKIKPTRNFESKLSEHEIFQKHPPSLQDSFKILLDRIERFRMEK